MRGDKDRSRSSLRDPQGFSFISILAVLVIGGLIYAAFFHLRPDGASQNVATASRGASQAVACQMNRQSLDRAISTWSISHPGAEPSLAALKESGTPILPCPDGGDFTIRNGKVHCSAHP